MSTRAARKNRLRRARRARHREERAIVKGEQTKVVEAILEFDEVQRKAGDVPDEELIAQRTRELLRVLNAYPDVKLLSGLAKCRDAEWHFGRLYLIGAITKTQLESASQAASVIEAYNKSIYPGGEPSSVDYAKVGRSSTEDISKRAENKQLQLKRKVQRVLRILHENEDHVRSAFFQALQGDLKVPLKHLREALDSLSMRKR